MSSSPHSFRASVDILEELQLIAAQNLEKLDIDKYYEVVCELGKGTYGKVDLVVHKMRGEPQPLRKFNSQLQKHSHLSRCLLLYVGLVPPGPTDNNSDWIFSRWICDNSKLKLF